MILPILDHLGDVGLVSGLYNILPDEGNRGHHSYYLLPSQMSLPYTSLLKAQIMSFKFIFISVWFRTSPSTARISRKNYRNFPHFPRRQRNKATPHKSYEASEATTYNARQFQYTPTQHESVPHPRCSQPATKYSRKCSGTPTADRYGISDCTSNMLGSSQRHIVPNFSAWLCESFHWILKPQILGKCPEWEGNCEGRYLFTPRWAC